MDSPDAFTEDPTVKLYCIPVSVNPASFPTACSVIFPAISSAVNSDELVMTVATSAITLPGLKDSTKQVTKLSPSPMVSKESSNYENIYINTKCYISCNLIHLRNFEFVVDCFENLTLVSYYL